MAKRALNGRAAACKERVNQRAQGADRIRSRSPCLTRYVHLDRANASHVYLQIEIAIYPAHGRTQVLVKFGELQSSDLHSAHTLKVDIARPIHPEISTVGHLTPDTDPQFVVWTDDIVGGHRSQIVRREGGRNVAEKVRSIDRKQLTCAGSYKSLKLRRRLRA